MKEIKMYAMIQTVKTFAGPVVVKLKIYSDARCTAEYEVDSIKVVNVERGRELAAKRGVQVLSEYSI